MCSLDLGIPGTSRSWEVHLQHSRKVQSAAYKSIAWYAEIENLLWTPALNDARDEHLFGVISDIWANAIYRLSIEANGTSNCFRLQHSLSQA